MATKFKDFLKEQMKNPNFRKEYEALELEDTIIQAFIDVRKFSGLTQKQLSEKKTYQTSFGNFYYRDVPSDVFYLEVISLHEDEYYFKIASPEKALCDKLYSVAPVRSFKRIAELLEEDLRIDCLELEKINIKTIEEIAPLYHSSNVTLLAKFLTFHNAY